MYNIRPSWEIKIVTLTWCRDLNFFVFFWSLALFICFIKNSLEKKYPKVTIKNKNEQVTFSWNRNIVIKELMMPAHKYILGKIALMKLLAFFWFRLIKVLGATIAEKKTRLPNKKGIKKFTKKSEIDIFCAMLTSNINCQEVKKK